MSYLLDSNIIIAGLNGDPLVLARLSELSPDAVILCAPVLGELQYGGCSRLARGLAIGQPLTNGQGPRFCAGETDPSEVVGNRWIDLQQLYQKLNHLGLIQEAITCP